MAKKKSKKEHGVSKIFETFENVIAAAGSGKPKPKKKIARKKK